MTVPANGRTGEESAMSKDREISSLATTILFVSVVLTGVTKLFLWMLA